MGRTRLLLLPGIVMMAACTGFGFDTTTTAPPTTAGPSDMASAYLDEALGAIREQSVYQSADWESIEKAAFSHLSHAETPADTYSAIELALRLLDDDASSFFTPLDVDGFFQGPAEFDPPQVELLPNRLGYVSIGKFLGDVGEDTDSYAADLAGRIDAISEETCGWVVDLRTATFGNPWPALGGLAALMDLGKIGGFTHADGSVEIWENGGAMVTLNGEVMVRNGRADEVPPIGQPVAVMVSPVTGQPGEGAAIALNGQSAIRSFGQPTRGHTGNIVHIELSDGAVISLITASFTDRLGIVYGPRGPFVPTEQTPNPTATEAIAIDWLSNHPNCLE